MSIIKAINRAFIKKEERNWDKIYIFIDIHETILYPTYEMNSEKRFYPYAKDVLQYLSSRSDISLGLYTCSYPNEIDEYIEFFKKNDIIFEHVNINKSEENNKYGFFEEKPYFNVLIEDKAGFDAEKEWEDILYYFRF